MSSEVYVPRLVLGIGVELEIRDDQRGFLYPWLAVMLEQEQDKFKG